MDLLFIYGQRWDASRPVNYMIIMLALINLLFCSRQPATALLLMLCTGNMVQKTVFDLWIKSGFSLSLLLFNKDSVGKEETLKCVIM